MGRAMALQLGWAVTVEFPAGMLAAGAVMSSVLVLCWEFVLLVSLW
jgi:hypothetical protein